MERSEDEIREAITSSKAEMRKEIAENNQLKRTEKKAYFDEKREEKMFQFDVKKKVGTTYLKFLVIIIHFIHFKFRNLIGFVVCIKIQKN